MDTPDTIQDEQLLTVLVKKRLVTRTAIEPLIQQQQVDYEQALKQINGHRYTIVPEKRILLVRDWQKDEIRKEIPLAFGAEDAEPLDTSGWVKSENAALLVNPIAGTSEGFLTWGTEPPSLVVTPTMAYLCPLDPLTTPILGLTQQLSYPGLHRGAAPHTAYDLYVGPDYSQLFIVDREAGQLLIFSTRKQQITDKVPIRLEGSKQSLNLAFDRAKNRIFLTDNQSFILYILNLESLYLEKLDIGLGGNALGNLVLAPDGKHLFVLTIKPQVKLLYFHLATKTIAKTILLKGDLFSAGQGEPQDLMVLTPDHKHLLMMTYLDEPNPFTPLVTVISTEEVKTIRRYTIKDHTKPTLFAFPYTNTIQDYQKSLSQLLLEKGLITHQTLEQVQQEMGVVDLDDPNGPVEGQGKVPTLEPLAADPIALAPADALPIIEAALFNKFYRLTEIDLTTYPDERQRVQMEAERARTLIETHDSVEILLTDILSEHTLEMVISRQEILMLMEKAALEKQTVAVVPTQCPNCLQPLDSWDCPACGLELESPERALKKQKSSLLPLANLPQFHLLLADPKRNRLLILDPNRTLDWELDAEKMPSSNPWGALQLPNKNILVVDRDDSQVYECGPSGSVKWVLEQDRSTELELNRPVKVTYFKDQDKEQILIVDQGNHRVLMVDRDGMIHWEYGMQGIAGSQDHYLCYPSDVQLTHTGTFLIADTGNDRIIEIQEQTVIRIFGTELGLSAPISAQRLLNEHTLIVDSSNYRVLELDPDGDVAMECFYYKEEMGEDMRMDGPILVIRGEKQNLILMDEDKIIELIPAKHRLVWSTLTTHLARRIEIKQDNDQKAEQYAQSFYQYKMPTMDEVLERLRERQRSGNFDYSALGAKILENFTRLLEVRRVLDSKRAQRSKVKNYGTASLAKVPIYCIDKINHHILKVDRTGKVLWHFGTQRENKLLRPNHITETDNSILIADTGNRRVLEVDLISQYVTLSIGSKESRLLAQPRSAFRTLSGHILVADEGNRRLAEFNAQGKLIWEFKNITQVVSPYYAAELGTGSILFVDWALQMVKEIARDGTVLWSYGQSRRMGRESNQLAGPEYAVRLAAGSTLIADTQNNRVLEVAPNRAILREFTGTPELELTHPNYCKRLPDGHTLIAFDNDRQLLEVDKVGKPCWHFELGNNPLMV